MGGSDDLPTIDVDAGARGHYLKRALLHQSQEYPNENDEQDEDLDDNTAVPAHDLIVPASIKQ